MTGEATCPRVEPRGRGCGGRARVLPACGRQTTPMRRRRRRRTETRIGWGSAGSAGGAAWRGR
eukprot:scaffold12150_cov98-Isochrysis_galbana.AAC.1